MRRLAACAAALAAAAFLPAAANAATITVETAADEYGTGLDVCSLREAIEAANTNAGFAGCEPGGADEDVIQVASALGPHVLTRPGAPVDGNDVGDLDIDTDAGAVKVAGTGDGPATLDGAGLHRLFDVTGDLPFALHDLTVRNGHASQSGGTGRGGALRWISTAGTADLTVTDSLFEGNLADGAGSLEIQTPGDHRIEASRFTGSISFDHGVIRSFGDLVVDRSALLDNIGGGIQIEGAANGLTLDGSTLGSNRFGTQESIGAIHAAGDVTIENSTVTGNSGGFVGGVRALGDLSVHFSTIASNLTGNAAGDNAGGIDTDNANSVLLDGVILAGNRRGEDPSNCNDTSALAGPSPSLEDGDTCGLAPPSQSGTDPQLDLLRDNGGPTPTQGLYAESPALDAAGACGVLVDQRGLARDASACDVGAFEGVVPRPVVVPPEPQQQSKTGGPKCKAKKRVCCSRKQKIRGKPRYCRKKGRGKRSGPKRPAGKRSAPRAASTREVIGRSVQGRPIVATRIGDPDGDRVALVVGVIHGDERAGLRVVRELKRRWSAVKNLQLWVIKSLNPDGQRMRSRKNARGVDLNRNFPFRWRGGVPKSSGYYPGRSPASEPETKAAMRLIRRIQPDVSVWYHQPWGAVLACGGRPAIAARYASLARTRTSCRGRGLRGTAISWQRNELPASDAFVVEFGDGAISGRTARRHARAAALVGRDGIAARRSAAAAKPRVRKRLIPYGKGRLNDMARYSKRHYGEHSHRLEDPRQIVIHYAVAGSVGAIYNTFAHNRPDPEYGERPNVCTHFAVGARGETVKFVRPTIRCRHVVGLNHVSIGIEHVGFSDGEVLDRKRQLKASLRLSHSLRCRFGIPVKDVIGHNESLRSRFYKELDPDFKGKTHGDFKRKSMRIYRRALARMGEC